MSISCTRDLCSDADTFRDGAAIESALAFPLAVLRLTAETTTFPVDNQLVIQVIPHLANTVPVLSSALELSYSPCSTTCVTFILSISLFAFYLKPDLRYPYGQKEPASRSAGMVPAAGGKGRQTGRLCGRKGVCRQADKERACGAGEEGEYRGCGGPASEGGHQESGKLGLRLLSANTKA
jgi:hypothetical protein